MKEQQTPSIRIKEGKEELYQSLVEANSQGAGSAIIDFANRWGAMMEERIVQGASVAEAAEATMHKADTVGLSGSMWGFGYATLRDCWEHGDELQAWGAQEYPFMCGQPKQDENPAEQEQTPESGPTMTQSM